MKKQIKKTFVCLMSALMLQSAAVIPANAAPATVTGTNFDNCTIKLDASNHPKIDNAVTVRRSDLTIETITGDDGTTYKTDDIAIVADPKAQYAGDKALKIDTAKKTSKLFTYLGGAGNVRVWEFDVMFTGSFHNFQVDMLDNENKEMRLIGSADSEGKMMIKPDFSGTSSAICEASLNEWHHIQIVADTTDTYVEDGTTYLDTQKNKILVMFDDKVVHNSSLYDVRTTKTNKPQKINEIFIATSHSGTKALYIDNFRMYTAYDSTDNKNNETTFEIVPFDDYDGNSYMNGTTFKFSADSIMGADLGNNPVNKVVWYLDGEEKQVSTVYPFNFECSPTVAGKHTVSCEAFTDNDSEAFTYKEMSFYVEPKFRETVILSEDFNEYIDGTMTWTDSMEEGKWTVKNTTAEYVTGVTVDEEHGKSLQLGSVNGRRLDADLNTKIYDGIVKVSGEFYFDAGAGNNNQLLVLKLASGDTQSILLHGNSGAMQDRMNNSTELTKVKSGQWYKLDYVIAIKNGKAYYTAYLDGKQLVNNACADVVDASSISGVTFASIFNDSANGMIFDNLSVSTIEYYDNCGFYSGDKKVTSLEAMPGTVLTAKTSVVSPDENQQWMAVYNTRTNALLAVVKGTYDATTKMYTASYDLSNLDSTDDIKVKVFVWDQMRPNLETPEEIQ